MHLFNLIELKEINFQIAKSKRSLIKIILHVTLEILFSCIARNTEKEGALCDPPASCVLIFSAIGVGGLVAVAAVGIAVFFLAKDLWKAKDLGQVGDSFEEWCVFLLIYYFYFSFSVIC